VKAGDMTCSLASKKTVGKKTAATSLYNETTAFLATGKRIHDKRRKLLLIVILKAKNLRRRAANKDDGTLYFFLDEFKNILINLDRKIQFLHLRLCFVILFSSVLIQILVNRYFVGF
jgi:hypothetical protein